MRKRSPNRTEMVTVTIPAWDGVLAKHFYQQDATEGQKCLMFNYFVEITLQCREANWKNETDLYFSDEGLV